MALDIGLNDYIPMEVSWARRMKASGILPNENVVFAKRLTKIFGHFVDRPDPVMWNLQRDVVLSNYEVSTGVIR
ncbi:MAG: hypothetical protein ACRENG_21305, partial [bacterium]